MKIIIEKKKLPGIFEVIPGRIFDDRGELIRLYDEETFKECGIKPKKWKQISIVRSVKKNTLRGLHIQLPPMLEAKMILAARGRALWVVVDLRAGQTLGQVDCTILSADKHNILITPKGFAHGCLSLKDNTEVIAYADAFYREALSTGVIWDDPDLAVEWRLNGSPPIISKRHRQYQTWKNFLEKHGPILKEELE